MQVIPTILSADKQEVEEWLVKLREAQKFARIQIDFIDGEYANNRTIRPEEVDLRPFLPMRFDAHLMVTEKNVGEWARNALAAGFDRVAVQTESISEPGDYTGLGLDIHSPAEMLKPYLGKLELVILMSVEPGNYGQDFDSRVIGKVKQLAQWRMNNNFRYRICIDGGVQKGQVEALARAGADEVVVGMRRVMEW